MGASRYGLSGMTELIGEHSGAGTPGLPATPQARRGSHARRGNRDDARGRSAEPAARQLEVVQALAELSREGIALVGADGVILYANPAIAQVLGCAANESVGCTFVSL